MNEHAAITHTGPTLTMAISAGLAVLLPDDSPARGALTNPELVGAAPDTLLQSALAQTAGPDADLLNASHGWRLSGLELLATAVAAAVETSPAIVAGLRELQGDAFGPWPCLATLARLAAILGIATPTDIPSLARLTDLGLIQRLGDRMPGPEERFALTAPVLMASGLPHSQTCAQILSTIFAPAPWVKAAQIVAHRLDAGHCLILRDGDILDRKVFATAIAKAASRQAMVFPQHVAGLGAAAQLGHWLPVDIIRTSRGTRHPLPPLPGYDGPRIALIGSEGGLEPDADWQIVEAALPPLPPDARRALWHKVSPGADMPLALFRTGPARVGAIAARLQLGDMDQPEKTRLRAALGADYRAEMEPQAKWVPQDVAAADFITDAETRADLLILLARCRHLLGARESRIKGVKALLSGPSGIGKTMAASWISTELGVPLFKLDLSAVVSKYIGETEENLSAIMDRAEAGDMVLLMDEADSLFAARTETKDSVDRFANNQTNFLLTRIETFDGIAILTSNGPERFDPAFARRLDQVVEMPLPSAAQRRAIWRVNLDAPHDLSGGDINRLAGLIDLAGGHIRNIAHTARVLASADARGITMDDLATGVTLEYKKLGRTPPGGFGR